MDPTTAYESTPSAVGSSADVSRANVGFVVGGQPKFADETADLLRRRLAAVTLALTIMLSLAFIGSIVQGIMQLLWFRVVILAVLVGCLAGLCSRRPFTLFQLRGFELVVFGVVVIQVSVMLANRLAGYAEANDAASVIGVKYLFMGAWCLIVLIYGIFVPNTWKRGAAVMVSIAIVPYAVLRLLGWMLRNLLRWSRWCPCRSWLLRVLNLL